MQDVCPYIVPLFARYLGLPDSSSVRLAAAYSLWTLGRRCNEETHLRPGAELDEFGVSRPNASAGQPKTGGLGHAQL